MDGTEGWEETPWRKEAFTNEPVYGIRKEVSFLTQHGVDTA